MEKQNPIQEPRIIVVKMSVHQVLEELKAQNNPRRVAVLSFANPASPGGCFLQGTNSQEDALCRTSNLYYGLLSHIAHYNECNRHPAGEFRYMHDLLYSQNVEFCKNEAGEEYVFPLDADVITCSAPNIRAMNNFDIRNPEYTRLLEERIAGIRV